MILPKLLVDWEPPGAVIGGCPPRVSIINLSLQKRGLDRAVQLIERVAGEKGEDRARRGRKKQTQRQKQRR
jgi:hypothetical protein